ncbi:MAG: cytochrome c biogenesis protein CcsA, partial [Anaerolineales bacterium]|nr:cytochrome c biogenesis protein CcsA [Anaerolineales bacterium]
MLADFGFTAMFLSLLCAIYAAVLSLAVTRADKRQWLASARNAAIAAWPLLTLACFCLIYLLLNEHFEIEYVARVSSRAMPWYLKATALWGGQAGSLLFWAWLMSGYTALVMMRDWRHERDMQPYVIAATMCTLAFFIGLNVFVENPFTKLWIDRFGQTSAAFLAPSGAQPFAPTDGQGLNPLLRHPGMIIHPPMLYLGFVGFVIPYSFAIAALAVRRSDDIWIRITRRWTLISWL